MIFLLYASCTGEVFSADDRGMPQKLLLKDFRPRSIYNVPRTKFTKARYPAIDMHAHSYADNNEQLIEWIRIMDELGIEKAKRCINIRLELLNLQMSNFMRGNVPAIIGPCTGRI